MDSSQGALALAPGHHASPDLTVAIEWITAKALLIDGQVQAVMSAFMGGKIKVEGDMTKLVALQQLPPDPLAVELLERLRAMTA
jgi:putative sterol carrier protein